MRWWLALALAAPDRSAPPPVEPAPLFSYAEPTAHALPGGHTAWHARVEGVRKVVVEVHLERGALQSEPAVAEATGWLWGAATQDLDGSALQEALALHQAELWTETSLLRTRVGLSVSRSQLDAGLDLLGEVLREPAFTAADVRRYRTEELRWRQLGAAGDPGTLASEALRQATYPASHPFGDRVTPRELRRVRRGRLLRQHRRWLAQAPLQLLVVGDVAWSEVEASVQALVDGLGAPGGLGTLPPVSGPTQDRVLGIALPGARQAMLRMRQEAPAFAHADRPAVSVLDDALGGSFLSRLNASLREDLGLTYGAWSSYAPGRVDGTWTLGVDVAAPRLGEAMTEVERILDTLAEEGITEDERQRAVRAAVAAWNQLLADGDTAASFYGGRVRTPESVATARARIQAQQDLTLEQLTTVAGDWLGRPRLWLVLGDPEVLAPQLDALGLQATWVDPQQAIDGDL